MLLSPMRCDGCGRRPNLLEWFRGEFSQDGYAEWRHPGYAFKRLGYALSYDNRGKMERIFQQLFGHEMPEDTGHLCPHCQKLAEEELPRLWAEDEGDDTRAVPRYYMG